MRWEYRILDFEAKWKAETEREEMLNRLGDDAWELVAVSGVGSGQHVYLRRPKP